MSCAVSDQTEWDVLRRFPSVRRWVRAIIRARMRRPRRSVSRCSEENANDFRSALARRPLYVFIPLALLIPLLFLSQSPSDRDSHQVQVNSADKGMHLVGIS